MPYMSTLFRSLLCGVTVAQLCCEYSISTPGENDEHDRELWLPVYFAANKPSYEQYGR